MRSTRNLLVSPLKAVSCIHTCSNVAYNSGAIWNKVTNRHKICRKNKSNNKHIQHAHWFQIKLYISRCWNTKTWVESWRRGSPATWYCCQQTATPGIKTAAPPWPDSHHISKFACVGKNVLCFTLIQFTYMWSSPSRTHACSSWKCAIQAFTPAPYPSR